jgi:hypothetical protein
MSTVGTYSIAAGQDDAPEVREVLRESFLAWNGAGPDPHVVPHVGVVFFGASHSDSLRAVNRQSKTNCIAQAAG